MILQEAEKLIGKKVKLKGTFVQAAEVRILKVRQIPNTDIVVAELDDGAQVVNIDILKVVE